MKKYMLFAWDQYYPQGGMNDFIRSFDTVEEAKTYLLESSNKYDHYSIVDRETFNEMESN